MESSADICRRFGTEAGEVMLKNDMRTGGSSWQLMLAYNRSRDFHMYMTVLC